MLEKTPELIINDDVFNLMVDSENSFKLKRIQDEYSYWNKVKYKANKDNRELFWSAVKLQRKINSKQLYFGSHRFSFPSTDFIQKTLHQFDMNIGGTMGSNIGIAETDKTKFVISSIMEEAISSSQMEGANTTRRKAKEMIQKEQKPRTKSEQMILK